MLRIFTKPDRNSQKLTAGVAIILFPFSSALTGKPGKKKRMKVRRKKKKTRQLTTASAKSILSQTMQWRTVGQTSEVLFRNGEI